MYYKVNEIIGELGDTESFNGLIAECLEREGKVEVIPLAGTRKDLFDEIINKSYEIAGLVSAIRNMATLHQEGTLVDYNYNDYITLASLVKEHCDKIIFLAGATDPEEEGDYLKPLIKPDHPGPETKNKSKRKEG